MSNDSAANGCIALMGFGAMCFGLGMLAQILIYLIAG